MVIKHYYNLSDHQVQYQITDRQGFKDFLGLASGDKVPDEKTIWAFSEKMAKSGLSEKLFQQFVDELNSKGLIFNEGQIIDASFVRAKSNIFLKNMIYNFFRLEQITRLGIN